MAQLYRIKLCCKPLVMIEVWNYMCVNVVD